MTYIEAIQYLEMRSSLGARLGLERMQEVLEQLGNPQEKLSIIHVAGTNGKGSTCAMIASILREAGYHVGIYTSPHLESYRERYLMDGEMISEEDFAREVTEINSAIEKNHEKEQPTVFEVLTTAAFSYFAKKQVDFLIAEVGLGGRYDATNVISKPVLSIITPIGMDHMDYLGDSIEQIAREKGGIIKENCPVVLSRQRQEAYCIIQEIAEEKNAKLYYAEKQNITVQKQTLEGTIFSIENEYLSYEKVGLSLLGGYQIENSAAVLLAMQALIDFGINLTSGNILEGIKKASWAGRMELMQKEPIILLDGAHNADGILKLSEAIQRYFKGKKIVLLLGVLGDKEYTKMIDLLIPLVEQVVITEPDNARALPAEELANCIMPYQKSVRIEKNRQQALLTARKLTKRDDVLLCAGSLYLIGEIRTELINMRK